MSDPIKEILAKFGPLREGAEAPDAKAIIEAIRLQTVVMAALLNKIEENTGFAQRMHELNAEMTRLVGSPRL